MLIYSTCTYNEKENENIVSELLPELVPVRINSLENVFPGALACGLNSDLGFNPQNDGEQIRINIPQLTEERRHDLMKQVKGEAEKGKVSIRNSRKEINDNNRTRCNDTSETQGSRLPTWY